MHIITGILVLYLIQERGLEMGNTEEKGIFLDIPGRLLGEVILL